MREHRRAQLVRIYAYAQAGRQLRERVALDYALPHERFALSSGAGSAQPVTPEQLHTLRFEPGRLRHAAANLRHLRVVLLRDRAVEVQKQRANHARLPVSHW